MENKTFEDIKFPLTLKYKLSKAGQEAALLSGVNAAEDQSVTSELPYSIGKKLGLSVSSSGNSYNQPVIPLKKNLAPMHRPESVYLSGSSYPIATFDTPKSFDELIEFELNRISSCLLLLKDEQDAANLRIEEYLADESRTDNPVVDYASDENQKRFYLVRGQREKRVREAQEAQAEELRLREENRKKEEEAIKLKQISDWVENFGTKNQRQRHAAGLLPLSEVLKSIEEMSFEPFKSLTEFQKSPDDEVRLTCSNRCGCYYDTCKINRRSEEPEDGVSSEVWESFMKTKSINTNFGEVSNAEIRMYTAICNDEDCDPEKGEGIITKPFITVELTVGVFKFNRDFEV